MRIQSQDTFKTPAANPVRVLVADDSKLQRRILAAQLRKAGHEVVEAESGLDALKALKDNDISLVLSDWVMPGMDGLELCRAVRDAETDGYIYFILLTSKKEKCDIAAGLNSGADDFLTKPVAGEELQARLLAGQRILEMHSQQRRFIRELTDLHDAIDRDLKEARKLQQSLICAPVEPPKGLAIDLFLRSSGRVGGDLVGTFPISDTEIGVYSIDVSGHGIASALLSARVAGYLSPSVPSMNIAMKKTKDGYVARDVTEVVETLDEILHHEIETDHYLTICLAYLNGATGGGVMCQAGHPNPVLHRRNGEVEFLGDGGLPVGLIPGASYQATAFQMERGDRLMIYSDGISECGAGADDMLGDAGTEKIMRAGKHLEGSAFFDAMTDALIAHTGSEDLEDDASAILIDRAWDQTGPNSPSR